MLFLFPCDHLCSYNRILRLILAVDTFWLFKSPQQVDLEPFFLVLCVFYLFVSFFYLYVSFLFCVSLHMIVWVKILILGACSLKFCDVLSLCDISLSFSSLSSSYFYFTTSFCIGSSPIKVGDKFSIINCKRYSSHFIFVLLLWHVLSSSPLGPFWHFFTLNSMSLVYMDDWTPSQGYALFIWCLLVLLLED